MKDIVKGLTRSRRQWGQVYIHVVDVARCVSVKDLRGHNLGELIGCRGQLVRAGSALVSIMKGVFRCMQCQFLNCIEQECEVSYFIILVTF